MVPLQELQARERCASRQGQVRRSPGSSGPWLHRLTPRQPSWQPNNARSLCGRALLLVPGDRRRTCPHTAEGRPQSWDRPSVQRMLLGTSSQRASRGGLQATRRRQAFLRQLLRS
ncbi:hypothetical protein ACFPRL_01890 [Pseudoclavibacter helvolus]